MRLRKLFTPLFIAAGFLFIVSPAPQGGDGLCVEVAWGSFCHSLIRDCLGGANETQGCAGVQGNCWNCWLGFASEDTSLAARDAALKAAFGAYVSDPGFLDAAGVEPGDFLLTVRAADRKPEDGALPIRQPLPPEIVEQYEKAYGPTVDITQIGRLARPVQVTYYRRGVGTLTGVVE